MRNFKKLQIIDTKLKENNIKNYESFKLVCIFLIKEKNHVYINISKIGFYNNNKFIIENKYSGLLKNNLKIGVLSGESISFFVPFLIKEGTEKNAFPFFWINFSNLIKYDSGNANLELVFFNDNLFDNISLQKDSSWINKDSFYEITYF